MAFHLIPLICAAPAILNIAGATVPVDALKAAPRLAVDAARHAPRQMLVRDALPIAESFSAAFIPIPCVGLGVQAIVFLLRFSRPPTPEEQQRMWDQAQGVR